MEHSRAYNPLCLAQMSSVPGTDVQDSDRSTPDVEMLRIGGSRANAGRCTQQIIRTVNSKKVNFFKFFSIQMLKASQRKTWDAGKQVEPCNDSLLIVYSFFYHGKLNNGENCEDQDQNNR